MFAGGCTLSAAAALLGTGGDEPDGADLLDSADLVGRLVDKSLVMPLLAAPPSASGVGRDGGAPLPHAADAVALRPGEAGGVGRCPRRAGLSSRLVPRPGRDRTAGAVRTGSGDVVRARCATRSRTCAPRIDWAVASGDRDAALTIADACAWFWWLMGDLEEERLWLQAALAIPGPPSTVLAVRCRAWLGWCDAHVRGSGGLDEVLAARDDARRLGDPFTLGTVCLLGANISAFRGERELAEELGSEASAAMTVAGDVWGMGMAALLRAIVADLSGTAAEAAGHFERGIRLLEAGGDNCGLAIALSEYATQAERLGDYDAAWEALQRCRTLMAELDSPTFELTMVARLGTVALLQGRLDVAERYHELAVREIRRGGLRFTATMVLLARALSLRWTGRLAEARSTLEEAFSRLDEAQMPIGEAFCRSSLGFLAELEGRAEEAESWHRGALATAFGAGNRRGTALAIEGLAGAEALRGDGVRAAFMLGVADRLRRATGAPLPPGERRDVGAHRQRRPGGDRRGLLRGDLRARRPGAARGLRRRPPRSRRVGTHRRLTVLRATTSAPRRQRHDVSATTSAPRRQRHDRATTARRQRCGGWWLPFEGTGGPHVTDAVSTGPSQCPTPLAGAGGVAAGRHRGRRPPRPSAAPRPTASRCRVPSSNRRSTCSASASPPGGSQRAGGLPRRRRQRGAGRSHEPCTRSTPRSPPCGALPVSSR